MMINEIDRRTFASHDVINSGNLYYMNIFNLVIIPGTKLLRDNAIYHNETLSVFLFSEIFHHIWRCFRCDIEHCS